MVVFSQFFTVTLNNHHYWSRHPVKVLDFLFPYPSLGNWVIRNKVEFSHIVIFFHQIILLLFNILKKCIDSSHLSRHGSSRRTKIYSDLVEEVYLRLWMFKHVFSNSSPVERVEWRVGTKRETQFRGGTGMQFLFVSLPSHRTFIPHSWGFLH